MPPYKSNILLPIKWHEQKAESIKLVKGIVKFNPHLHVLCPKLANGSVCRKGKFGAKSKDDWVRPKLLIKNCGNPTLQLWNCEGCPDFLLRVRIENFVRARFYNPLPLKSF